MRTALALFAAAAVSLAVPALAGPEQGRDVFRRDCVGCHSIGCNKIGPMLGGVIDRPAATAEGYAGYSAALQNAGLAWTREALDAFLANPQGFLPGNGMSGYGRVADAAEREALLDFLESPDHTLDLCG